MSSDDGAEVGLLSPDSVTTRAAVSDAAVVRHLIDAELALMSALAAEGHAPASVAVVSDAVRRNRPRVDLAALARDSVAGGNPVIPLIPMLREHVAALDPAAADWVHRGATSQDILDTAMMTLAREVAGEIDGRLRSATAALSDLAERHRLDPAVARTLTQHAVPTTLGLKAALWSRGIANARGELARVVATLPAQLGGAGGTLASYVELFGEQRAAALPAAYAAQLGLAPAPLPWHTDRWPVTRYAGALAAVVASLGVFASDVALLARTEVGEASVGSPGGSSAMPQKRNPVDAVLIRSAALRTPALVANLHLAAALAVDERPDGAWHAEWATLQELMRVASGAADRAAALAAELVLHPDRARANLDLTGGGTVSERLALVLAPSIGPARFSELMSRVAEGGDLAALVRELPEAAGLEVGSLLDPVGYLGLAPAWTDAIVRDLRTGDGVS